MLTGSLSSHLRYLNISHFGSEAMGLRQEHWDIFSGMTTLLNFMIIYQLVQKLLVEDTTDSMMSS
jgi:hypothetical protein